MTALINTSASVQERFAYDPYGNAMVLNAGGSTTTDAYNWAYRYQGGRFDAATSLYLFRHRDYSAVLGRWMREDPVGYVNGLNRYQSELSDPVTLNDPSGLAAPVLGGKKNPRGGKDETWGGVLIGVGIPMVVIASGGTALAEGGLVDGLFISGDATLDAVSDAAADGGEPIGPLDYEPAPIDPGPVDPTPNPGPQWPDWLPKWVPWAIAGGLGLWGLNKCSPTAK